MRKTILLALVSLSLAASAFAQCETLTILDESVPTFQVNEHANFQFNVIGGTAPYTVSIYDGALPEGLHLTPRGRIVGKPTEISDTTVFIRLTDAAGCTFVQAFAVRVDNLQ